MSGPWEKFQAAQPTGNEGPWNRFAQAPAQEEPGFFQQIDNFVRTAANGATFGYADKLAAAMGGGNYDDNIKRERKQSDKAERDLGMMALPAELGGGIAAALATGGGSLAARGATMAGKVGYGALEGAGYGALNAAGHTDDGNYMKSVPEGAAVGAALGGALPVAVKGISKAVSPLAERMQSLSKGERANRALAEAEGIPMTAGMEAGLPNLKRAESVASQIPLGQMFGGGMEESLSNFRKAVAKRFGGNTDDLSPENLNRIYETMQNEYKALAGRNTLRDPNADFLNDILGIHQRAARELETAPGEVMKRRVEDIYNKFTNEFGGAMPGESYQALRAGLRNDIKMAERTNPREAAMLKDLKKSLDDMMERSVGPADAKAWNDLNNRYNHFKIVQRSMGAGDAATGNLSPLRFARQVERENGKEAFGLGKGNYSDLALMADDLYRGVPDSGTAGREFMTKLLSGGGLAGFGVGGGFAAGLPGALGAMAAPSGIASVFNSKPVQKYLTNEFFTKQREEVLRDMLQKYGPSGLLAMGY